MVKLNKKLWTKWKKSGSLEKNFARGKAKALL